MGSYLLKGYSKKVPRRIQAVPFFRPATAELRYLPECPRAIGNSLLWVSIQYAADQPRGGLNVLDLATGENCHHPLPGRPGFFAQTDDPALFVIGLERRLVLYDLARAQVIEILATLPDDERVIINDGIAIPGGLIFGTKHLQFALPIAALYHYDNATRELRELRGGQICSNGKFFDRDTLIDIDSQPKTITEYRYDGTLDPMRLIAPPNTLPALPDGLRPARGGTSIIVAYYNPEPVADGIAQEIRLSDGAVLTEWTLPGSPRVTCPEVVGDFVYFTTAVEGMPNPTPHSGSIFRAEL
jgi:sugar lactone lactonase YvrE